MLISGIRVVTIVMLGLATLWNPGHAAGQPLATNPDWTLYTDELGTRVEYPRNIFSVEAGSHDVGRGRDFTTSDGRGQLAIYVQPNPKRHTPASYLREHFRGSRSALNYDRVAPRFFALSTNRGTTILYRRCNFSENRGGTIHCVDISYPLGEKRAWDDTVTRISRSLRPLDR